MLSVLQHARNSLVFNCVTPSPATKPQNKVRVRTHDTKPGDTRAITSLLKSANQATHAQQLDRIREPTPDSNVRTTESLKTIFLNHRVRPVTSSPMMHEADKLLMLRENQIECRRASNTNKYIISIYLPIPGYC